MSAEERRELVLTAATRAFARGGFAGTSTDTIAREAGVSQPYVVRIFGTKQDISEAKAAEEKVKALQSELIHLSRRSAMGAMAATVAHELNQPLAAISNYAAGARSRRASPTSTLPRTGSRRSSRMRSAPG